MGKKDKIYELKIEEDDEISGIDSISLVDEPAIEIEWLAFKKECQNGSCDHNFSKDDEKYVSHLMTNAETEDDLLNQGWVVDSFEIITGKENFVFTDPNAPSIEDEKEYKVRYKYILNPNINGPALIDTSRPFCRELIRQNKVFRVEDIENAVNDFGQSPLVYRGSWNCRHVWARIKYRNDAEIINKASVNKGKTLVGGFPNDIVPDVRVLGYSEPSTVTTKTLNNPSPSTIRNLGLSKDKFELPLFPTKEEAEKLAPLLYGCNGSHEHIMDGKTYYMPCEKHPEDLGYDVSTLPPYKNELPTGKTEDFETYNDYPEAAKNNAKRALAWAEKNGWGSCGTPVGKQRANQLASGENISEETIARMASFERHRQHKDVPYSEGCGGLMWDAWGGDAGIEWAQRKLDSLEKEKMSKQKFQTDDEKRIVIGPAMVPDQKIIRQDKITGEPYYVFFSPETIKMIAEKYMRNKYIDNNDTQHDGKVVKDVYVIESWIKEDEQDKSNKYGFGNLPIGTWFVAMKVKNDEVWKRIKSKELNGFSVSGYFEEVAQFSREEMFLFKLAEILRSEK